MKLWSLRLFPLVSVLALAWLPSACVQEQSETLADEANIEEPSNGVFRSTNEFEFALEAPFAQLIARLRSGKADPPKPAKADAGAEGSENDGPEYSEPGTLKFGSKTLAVHVEIRGNTSAQDCAFPKYKIEFDDKEAIKGTPFQGNKKFRVNSHCGAGGIEDRAGQFQRIQNQISPIREELAYRIVRAAGIPTYRTRLTKIAYSDSSPTNAIADMDQYGLAIESGDAAAKRFAQSGLIDRETGVYLKDPSGRAERGGAEPSKMRPEAVASVFLAETLIGNFDYIFTDSGQFWNIDVFGVAHQATQLPIPQDFDLACGVLVNRDPRAEVRRLMDQVRTHKLDASALQRAAATFKRNESAILREIDTVERERIRAKLIASTDGRTSTDKGFVNARAMVDEFFKLKELAE